jgi:hypothetical protein
MTILQPALQNSFGKLFVITAALARKSTLTVRQVRIRHGAHLLKAMATGAFPARESLERYSAVGILG